MQIIEFHLRDDGQYVELCHLLKLTGIANSGGQGKLMVANGDVSVDGRPEIRKTAKIVAGQAVECRGTRIFVLAAGARG
jgi:ribosome-associated protein